MRYKDNTILSKYYKMGLHYNRFRYYSQDMRMYISSDSIGLEANNPTLCGYVQDVTLNEQK